MRLRLLGVEATGEGHRVTSLELFFDLVFVFALTQVTALMADDPTWRGALRGLIVLALLWWAWCSYAWLGNQARADEGLVRAAVIVAMGATFVMALTVPEAFDDGTGGLFAPFVLAACFAVVRLTHLTVYYVAAGSDAALRRQLIVTAVPVTAACLLLVAGGAVGPPYQTLIWALALLVDYSGVYLAGASGWRLPSATHFAERHGLILIIAIGESIVSIGVGAAQEPVSGVIVTASLLGLAVAVSLWWLYFDVVAPVAERVLARTRGEPRARLARDSYTYLHFPMVVGVIYLALGLKKVLGMVSGLDHYSLSDPLTGVPLVGMYGGVALYLLSLEAFRLRNVGTVNRQRLLVAVVLLCLLPVAWQLPALVSLSVLAFLLVVLISFETFRYAEARHDVRHTDHAAS